MVVSERMEMEEKRCGQLQRRLKCCDTRVAELEEKLWSRTQEVNLARETYRMLRKDLAQFNQNLTTTCDDDDSASVSSAESLASLLIVWNLMLLSFYLDYSSLCLIQYSLPRLLRLLIDFSMKHTTLLCRLI